MNDTTKNLVRERGPYGKLTITDTSIWNGILADLLALSPARTASAS